MTLDMDRFVGRDMYARDDRKVGTVTRVSEDGEFVIVDRALAPDLFVPMDEVREAGDHLIVDRARSFLDDAPAVDSEPLSTFDRQRLEQYYQSRAA